VQSVQRWCGPSEGRSRAGPELMARWASVAEARRVAWPSTPSPHPPWCSGRCSWASAVKDVVRSTAVMSWPPGGRRLDRCVGVAPSQIHKAGVCHMYEPGDKGFVGDAKLVGGVQGGGGGVRSEGRAPWRHGVDSHAPRSPSHTHSYPAVHKWCNA
jgi:hypothetical protein